MAPNSLAPWAEPVPDATGQGAQRMTAAELLALGDRGMGYELVEGILVQMSPTGGDHGDIALELASALRVHAKARHLGTVVAAETGFLLSLPSAPDTVLAPDAAFVRADRVPTRGSPERKGFWRLAPDLVVEVASPSESRPALAAKARMWLAAGVQLVWVIWPDSQTVDAWRPGRTNPAQVLTITNTLDGASIVPGFTHPVSELFA